MPYRQGIPRERVWLRDERGVHATVAVPPGAWRDDRPAIVGPFSNARCAQAFVALRARGPGAARVFPAKSAYFVELGPERA